MALRKLISSPVGIDSPATDQLNGSLIPTLEIDDVTGIIYAGGRALTGSGGSPGGLTTQVQFNDGGVFRGKTGFTFDKTTGQFVVGDYSLLPAAMQGYITGQLQLSDINPLDGVAAGTILGVSGYSDTGYVDGIYAVEVSNGGGNAIIGEGYPASPNQSAGGIQGFAGDRFSGGAIFDGSNLVGVFGNVSVQGAAATAYAVEAKLDNTHTSATESAALKVHVLNPSDPTAFAIKSDAGRICFDNPVVPANAASAGAKGEIAWDSGFLYACIAPSTWKRAAIATW